MPAFRKARLSGPVIAVKGSLRRASPALDRAHRTLLSSPNQPTRFSKEAPVVAHFYKFKPIADWSKWASDLLEVKTPTNLTCKAEVSPEGGSNINIILALLDQTRDVPGDVAECGVFTGGSLTAIALYLRENGLAKHVFGLDSFEGFDESVNKDIFSAAWRTARSALVASKGHLWRMWERNSRGSACSIR